MKVGFKSAKTYMTRRELKIFRRQTGCIFGFLFQIPSSIMIYGFLKDTIREACKEDVRFQRMDQVSQVIMFLVGVSGMYFLILAIICAHLLCRARTRAKK